MLEQQAEGLAAELVEEGAKDAFAVWQSGYDAYATYLGALVGARGPQDIVAANTQFLAATANIFASATGAMLQRAGVREPVLNDA